MLILFLDCNNVLEAHFSLWSIDYQFVKISAMDSVAMADGHGREIEPGWSEVAVLDFGQCVTFVVLDNGIVDSFEGEISAHDE